MNVKDAVRAAKAYLLDVLNDESITNLGLEEIEHDDDHGAWRVTLGFSRPWDHPRAPLDQFMQATISRDYRVVTVSEANGEVLSIKMRDPRS